jgi:cytochrome c oxidase cbb3-type subunit 2
MISLAVVYDLVPKLWKKSGLYSDRLVSWHFWLATLGIVLYASSMWVSGIMQGLMWREYDDQGFLVYSFAESVAAMYPYNPHAGWPALPPRRAYHGLQSHPHRTWKPAHRNCRRHTGSCGVIMGKLQMFNHATIERNATILLVLGFLTVAIGGIVEIAPLFYLQNTIEKVEGMRPYTPLELAGRNIYIREGCYVCHSQMIRPFRDEAERYGHYSLAAESMFDHPFQWGSKRTGPDLARVGNRYSDDWHREHLVNPRSVVPESVMPGYPFLMQAELNTKYSADHLQANRLIGVPYTEEMLGAAQADMIAQASDTGEGAEDLLKRYPKAQVRDFDGQPGKLTEMDALVAYLQMLGTLVDFSTFKAETDSR